jgi:hydrogenase nickel incorporation protein HypB
MCGVCGCGKGETRLEEEQKVHEHTAHAHHHHGHDHEHDHDHNHDQSHHEHAHAAHTADVHMLRDDPAQRAHLVSVEQDILSKNDALAAHNRQHFNSHSVLALNLVSSPGAGKTTLLVASLQRLLPGSTVAVIEGDQETSADADRIRATGAPAVQVNTGRGCHLDAAMIDAAFHRLHFHDGILFIENVGNLVCPAGFDLGEAHKVVIASVTEGEDKPLKYPNMFAAASLMLVSKVDLLPHLDFDVDLLIANARRVNPGIAVIRVSATSGEGIDRWLQWIGAARDMALASA